MIRQLRILLQLEYYKGTSGKHELSEHSLRCYTQTVLACSTTSMMVDAINIAIDGCISEAHSTRLVTTHVTSRVCNWLLYSQSSDSNERCVA